MSAPNLFGLRCPKCGDSERIDIAALVWLRVTPEGTDADEAHSHDHDWNSDSAAVCNSCGHCGRVREFEPAAEPAEA